MVRFHQPRSDVLLEPKWPEPDESRTVVAFPAQERGSTWRGSPDDSAVSLDGDSLLVYLFTRTAVEDLQVMRGSLSAHMDGRPPIRCHTRRFLLPSSCFGRGVALCLEFDSDFEVNVRALSGVTGTQMSCVKPAGLAVPYHVRQMPAFWWMRHTRASAGTQSAIQMERCPGARAGAGREIQEFPPFRESPVSPSFDDAPSLFRSTTRG